jgi:hypothetical protein
MIRTALFSLVVLFSTARVRAEPESNEHLSDRGRVLIAGAVGGWWGNREDWRISVDPSASYFLLDHLALGGYLGYSDGRTAPYGLRRRDFSLGAQVVADLPLGERASWYAVARVGYSHHRGDRAVFPGNLLVPQDQQLAEPASSPFAPLRNFVNFGLFLPFVFQVNEHVGIGFGPDIQIDWPPSHYYSIDVRLGLATWIPISI